jgi:ribonuclease T1
VLRRWRRPQLALLALVLAVGIGYGIEALRHSGSTATRSNVTTSASTARGSGTGGAGGTVATTVALSSLPVQVAQTVGLIKAGGPFPYSQDGVVFDNNEHLLPAQPRGYYHEYTVPTPGASDRATRRIVTGRAGEYFYTSDHYESFERINLTA